MIPNCNNGNFICDFPSRLSFPFFSPIFFLALSPYHQSLIMPAPTEVFPKYFTQLTINHQPENNTIPAFSGEYTLFIFHLWHEICSSSLMSVIHRGLSTAHLTISYIWTSSNTFISSAVLKIGGRYLILHTVGNFIFHQLQDGLGPVPLAMAHLGIEFEPPFRVVHIYSCLTWTAAQLGNPRVTKDSNHLPYTDILPDTVTTELSLLRPTFQTCGSASSFLFSW